MWLKSRTSKPSLCTGKICIQALLVVLCKGCIKAFTFPWWDKIVALEAACMAKGISAA